MKKLTLSLVIAMLTTTFLLGWALDSIFSTAQIDSSNDQDSLTTELWAYQNIGSALATTIDKQNKINPISDSWPQQDNLTLSINTLDSLFLPQILRSSFHKGQALVLHNDDFVTMHFYLENHQRVLTLKIVPQGSLVPDNQWQLIFTSLFYLGILCVILMWLYPLIKQLNQLKKTAHAFGQGDLSTRVSSQRFSYTSDIECEFNHMATRIESLINDNKLLSDAVSHDLRTPLSRLRFGIEALQETNDPARQKRYQQHLCNDIDEMEQLVNVLLQYARLDSLDNLQLQPIDITSLVNNISAQFEFSDKQFTWHLLDTTCLIKANQAHVKMMLNNLLSNAQQYAIEQVFVSLKYDDNSLTIIIEDDGMGIEESQRESLLKPFIRGQHARNNATEKGYGMGLAIVSRIAALHRASLVIDGSPTLGGARISITFEIGTN